MTCYAVVDTAIYYISQEDIKFQGLTATYNLSVTFKQSIKSHGNKNTKELQLIWMTATQLDTGAFASIAVVAMISMIAS